MQENFEVKGMAPCPSPISDECIITRRVYGRCRQQDCLRPLDSTVLTPSPGTIEIGSSRLGGQNPITNPIGGPLGQPTIQPGDIIVLDNNVVSSIQVVPGTFRTDVTASVAPSAFGQDGFYDLTIKYTFSYTINLLDENNNPIAVTINGVSTPNIPAFETYTKYLSLFGGLASQQPITTLDTFVSQSSAFNSNNRPYAFVQALANPIQAVVGTYEVAGTPATTEYHVDVTIGLFTIIKLFRIVNLTVGSTGDCDIPECEPITGDACEFFNSLPFPFEDFDPPTTL